METPRKKPMEGSIHASIWEAASGRVGCLALAKPSALNALDLEMVKSLSARLEAWAADPEIRLVVLHSEEPRAFCAGGDVKRIAIDLREGRGDSLGREFFTEEYALDHRIRTFPKPILAWGDGYVMGGGMGLLEASSHRVVTERSALSMPEITIGFFPDVGAGIFLNRLPEEIGLFLGWTSARLGGGDAVGLGLADHRIESGEKDAVFSAIRAADWSGDPGAASTRLTELLRARAVENPEAPFLASVAEIRSKLRGKESGDALRAMREWRSEDPVIQAALAAFRAGSPLSARLIHAHLARARGLSAKDVVALEWDLAMNAINGPDFREGVRALLIDKDRKPRWAHGDPESIPEAEIDAYFRSRPDSPAFRSRLASLSP